VKNQQPDFVLVDCLLIDFQVDEHLAWARLTCEMYISPASGVPKQKSLVQVHFGGLTNLSVQVQPEFMTDVARSYTFDEPGLRANEIYELKLEETPAHDVTIVSDMLSVKLTCNVVDFILPT